MEGALTWAFEFEEEPLFAGFRVLSTGGVTLPAFNVFRMFGKMSGRRLVVHSSGEVALDDILRGGVRGSRPDVSALAAIDGNTLSVLAWHYHDDEVPGPDAAVSLTLEHLPARAAPRMRLVEHRVDAEHSNAYTAWLRMGSPRQPTTEQYGQLEHAGQLDTQALPPVIVHNGVATVDMRLPRQSVCMLVFSW